MSGVGFGMLQFRSRWSICESVSPVSVSAKTLLIASSRSAGKQRIRCLNVMMISPTFFAGLQVVVDLGERCRFALK